jgi:GDPmannose 4,6-dehydratase
LNAVLLLNRSLSAPAVPPIALITGITGQDGSYLTELLLGKGYIVHGIVRRSSMFNRSRIEHLRADPTIYDRRLFLHYADLHDVTSLRRIIRRVNPGELYHLAGQSHVGLSFEIPESTCAEVANSTLSLLEICRDLESSVAIYHASSSEIFGAPGESEIPQTEATPMRPRSPYGAAKAFATHLCQIYREAYGLFVCSGIAYNHESPRRGENFVTRKISAAAARIKAGRQDSLSLGNLSAERDWGFAGEYVEAMWRMLQQEKAADYILSTGNLATVRDFVTAGFAALGMDLRFEGEGENEQAFDANTGRCLVTVDPRFFRPADPEKLIGNPARAEHELGWRARIRAPELAAMMAEADWNAVRTSVAASANVS